MQTHVRVLGILHLVFGGFGILAALFLLALFGGLAGVVGMSGDPEAVVAVPVLGGIGAVIAIVTTLLSIPSIIAGIGLLSYKPWARILTLILSVFHLMNIPFGTALGFYGFWVLLSKEVIPMFERPAPYAYPPSPPARG